VEGAERDHVPPQDEDHTILAAVLFDDLVDSLARPARPNDALARAAERARQRALR
jgi:uncharacterized protein (DUF1778 family)